MVFEIKNKIALITGGASGIGLDYAKELLRNGAKGITIADINSEQAAKALEEIENEFGPKKAIFVQTDITDQEQFENAFLETIKEFKYVDILINNAAVVNELEWEKAVKVNVNGTLNGIFLGMDKYLSQYKQTDEALIVNIASIAAMKGFSCTPVYTATKHAVMGMVKSWGVPEFYDDAKVRVVAICPGITTTPLMAISPEAFLNKRYLKWMENQYSSFPTQGPEIVAKEGMKVIEYAQNGTIWVIEGGEPAYEFIVPERSTMKNNVISSQ